MSNDRSVLKIDEHPEFRPVGNNSSNTLPPGGGPPYNGDMERRVSNLEDKMENVQKTLSSILVTLAKIESCMATKEEIHAVEISLTEVKARVNSLPTLAKISTIAGIASLVVPLLLAVSMALLHHYTKLI
ncbi:hypothetical protein [Bombella apis]|uniref:Uncharacterized protein n=1 Tax=Bombella apis TaxID=1785988 RepID=A0ABR9MNW9_9PROT|nr:hypothetical protein [Bombella apis]MBE1723209.1 hypothetical protein [Bombella apis]MBR9731016.1 hypothetical protein [Bombella apis]